jgi:hypothetical protein
MRYLQSCDDGPLQPRTQGVCFQLRLLIASRRAHPLWAIRQHTSAVIQALVFSYGCWWQAAELILSDQYVSIRQPLFRRLFSATAADSKPPSSSSLSNTSAYVSRYSLFYALLALPIHYFMHYLHYLFIIFCITCITYYLCSALLALLIT